MTTTTMYGLGQLGHVPRARNSNTAPMPLVRRAAPSFSYAPPTPSWDVDVDELDEPFVETRGMRIRRGFVRGLALVALSALGFGLVSMAHQDTRARSAMTEWATLGQLR